MRLYSKYKYLVLEKQTCLRAENKEENRIAIANLNETELSCLMILGWSYPKMSQNYYFWAKLLFCTKEIFFVEHITAIEQLCEIIEEREDQSPSDRRQFGTSQRNT